MKHIETEQNDSDQNDTKYNAIHQNDTMHFGMHIEQNDRHSAELD